MSETQYHRQTLSAAFDFIRSLEVDVDVDEFYDEGHDDTSNSFFRYLENRICDVADEIEDTHLIDRFEMCELLKDIGELFVWWASSREGQIKSEQVARYVLSMIPSDADENTTKDIVLGTYQEACTKYQYNQIPGEYLTAMVWIVFALDGRLGGDAQSELYEAAIYCPKPGAYVARLVAEEDDETQPEDARDACME